MIFKLNDNYTAAGILIFSLLVTGFLVAGAQTEPADNDDEPEIVSTASITFPVAELGNCANKDACKKYCDDPNNAEPCLNFAEKHNLMSADNLTRARKMSSIVKTGGGPGGCRNKRECENYCEASTDRLTECLAFAEQSGLVPPKELQEMRQVHKALAGGAKLPGGCKNKRECDGYCSDSAHIEECISFAESSGMLQGKELDEAKRVLPFIKRGEMPGGCKNKAECDAYCSDSNHAVECVTFAEKAGFMSKEEAEMARKTGGRGPGGCNSRESCDAFCNQKENQETCFNFAKEHNLIPEEQMRQMKEGMTRLRIGLREMPGEVVQCLKDKMGPDIIGRIESGTLTPSRDLGDTIQGCFTQFKPQMTARMQEGLRGATPEVLSCLKEALGEEGFQKMQQGEVDDPEKGDRIKVCFGKMKEAVREQMKEGARQFDNMPPQARDCIKQKLGDNFFEKMQSGNPEEMEGIDSTKIDSAITQCVKQGFGGEDRQGGEGQFGPPDPERIKEMMQEGKFPGGAPSAEQIKEKMRERGVPEGFPGAPSPEQIKEMMQSGKFPEGAPSPEQIKEMMQGKGILDIMQRQLPAGTQVPQVVPQDVAQPVPPQSTETQTAPPPVQVQPAPAPQ